MDFRFTPEQEALQREVRAFLQQEVPPDHPEAHIGPEEGTEEEWEFAVQFSKKLAKRGWYTAGWPKEHGGLDEVWVHPVRLLRDFEVGLIKDHEVQWLREIPAQIEIRPEAITRAYRLSSGTLTETLVAALDRPGGLIRLQVEGTGPLRLLLRFRVDFRWMWPYPEDALGSLHFGYDEGLHALHVHDRSGDFYALYGADRPPDAHLAGAFEQIDYADGQLVGAPTDQNQIYQAFLFSLDPTNRPTLHVALAGTNQGRDEAAPESHQT